MTEASPSCFWIGAVFAADFANTQFTVERGRSQTYTDRLTTYEVGRVYLPENGDGVLPEEVNRASLLLTGPRRESGFQSDPGAEEFMDFYDL